MSPTDRQLATLKAIVFLLGLVPLAWLGLRAGPSFVDAALAGPATAMQMLEPLRRSLGLWALAFLVATLSITPLRRFCGLAWLARLRRLFGLYAFFYAALHVGSHFWPDPVFARDHLAAGLTRQPFMAFGLAAFALLLPLAATSSRHAVRALGGRRWQALHRAIYPLAIFAVIHAWAMARPGVATSAFYALAVLGLLVLRGLWRNRERHEQLAGKFAAPPPARRRGKIIPIVSRRE